MLAERYILVSVRRVTGRDAVADAGRDAETDVAIEDEWCMEVDRGAEDGTTRILWSVGNGFVDDGRDLEPGAGYFVLDDAASDTEHGTDRKYEDRPGSAGDVRQQV